MNSFHADLQEALLRNQKKYRYILDEVNSVVLVVDGQLKITFVCESAASVLQVSPESLPGQHLFLAFHFPGERVLRQQLKALMQTDHSFSLRTELAIRTGDELMYFEAGITNLLTEPDIYGIVFYLRNMTDYKRSQLELQRLRFELDSFVYKASHDMRLPLLNLLGLIDVMQLDFPEQKTDYLDLMKRSVLKLDKFILELTEYSRNDRTEVTYAAVDMDTLVWEILEALNFLPKAAGIQFMVAIDMPPLLSDPARLRVILNNLLSNAIKYHDLSKPTPFIKVSAWENPALNQLVLQVQDNGCGIPELYTAKVFDMFFRATDQSDGSGLGLYIVQKVVDKLDGRVELKTKYQEGTTVTVFLPLLS